MTGKTALIVIGMHRSGTSAIARLLSLAGAALPDDLLGAGPGNETGHWEPKRIVNFNDDVLAAFDTQWNSPFGLGMSARRRTALGKYVEGARKLIRDEYADQPIIVIKEPRISLLADLWIAACEAEQYRCKFVIMVRNPVEVAASLRRRNGMPFDQALVLWGAYEASSELLTRQHDRVFCRYEDVLVRPASVLDEIEAELNLKLPRGTAKAHSEMNAFVRPNMRHNNAQTLPAIPPHLGRIGELADYINAKMAGVEPSQDISHITQEWLADLDQIAMPIIIGVREESAGAMAQAREQLGAKSSEVDQLVDKMSDIEAKLLVVEADLNDTQEKLGQSRNELNFILSEKVETDLLNVSLRMEIEVILNKVCERDTELACMRAALKNAHVGNVPLVKSWLSKYLSAFTSFKRTL